MSGPLSGAVALVTGASSGIGAATALELSRLGASVALVARRTDRIEELAGQLDGDALAITSDISDRAGAEAAVQETVTSFGRLDILINNAGLMLIGPATAAPIDEWERMVQLNVLGLMYCTKAAMPHLLAAADDPLRGVGDIVNISSVAGRKAQPGSAVYAATKFAVGAFSDGIRQELAGKKVRVSLVEPGLTDTELADHIRPEVLEPMRPVIAAMPKMQSEDVAAAIAFSVTRPAHVAISELLIRPTAQER